MALKRKATKKKLKAAKKCLKAAKYQHKIVKTEVKGKWDSSSVNAARTKKMPSSKRKLGNYKRKQPKQSAPFIEIKSL